MFQSILGPARDVIVNTPSLVPLTTGNLIHKNVFVIGGTRCTQTLRHWCQSEVFFTEEKTARKAACSFGRTRCKRHPLYEDDVNRFFRVSRNQKSMQASGSTIVLRPRVDIIRSPKQGYRWPHKKRTFVLEIFFSKKSFLRTSPMSVPSCAETRSCAVILFTFRTFASSVAPATRSATQRSASADQPPSGAVTPVRPIHTACKNTSECKS